MDINLSQTTHVNHTSLSQTGTVERPVSAKQEDRAGSSYRQDRVTISKEARELNEKGEKRDEKELSPEQEAQVAELKKRDAEVRTHEQAHLAAAGELAKGGAQYQMTTGPDGKQYATGGSVNIDMSAESTPEATMVKMRRVQKAALAPQEPSSTDRQVAQSAAAKERESAQKIKETQMEDMGDTMTITEKDDGSKHSEEAKSANKDSDGVSRLAIQKYRSMDPVKNSLALA